MHIDEIINKYLIRGFGSMNKNDFEVWIFHWLLFNHEKCIDRSDFFISQFLKIPESKVKRLRYEAELKYSDSQPEDYREELIKSFKKAKCQEGTIEGKITMSVPNKILRQYLSDILIEDGRFLDGSFYSNVVTMSAGNFIYIIDHLFLDEADRKTILEGAKKNIEKGKEMPKTISESFSKLGISIGKSILEKIVGSSADEIVKTIKEIIENQSE